MSNARRKRISSTDDKVEAKRKIIRQPLDVMTGEVAAMQDAQINARPTYQEHLSHITFCLLTAVGYSRCVNAAQSAGGAIAKFMPVSALSAKMAISRILTRFVIPASAPSRSY
jgi:hypothetical protein